MNINEWISKTHELAKAKGWWDRKRGVPELLCLMHSEIDEAAEQYRLGKPMLWHGENGKPEGVAVELIDCAIRAFDFVGFTGCTDFYPYIFAERNLPGTVKGTEFYEIISRAHESLSTALESHRTGDSEGVLDGIAQCCNWIFAYLGREDICIQGILREKHAYNETRPYRHGGKKA